MPKNNHSLLSTLKNLYTQLSQISWGLTVGRINSYKRESKAPSNITAVLNKKIEDLSLSVMPESVDSLETMDELEVQNVEKDKIKTKESKVENLSGIESDFAKYLKQRKPVAITQPQLGDNLKSSAWQHIHTAIRHAKNGDIESAKLHTSIAGSALEEAGDYMSQEEYSALVLAIEDYFSDPLK